MTRCGVIQCIIVPGSPHFLHCFCVYYIQAYLPRGERRKTARRLLVKAGGKRRKALSQDNEIHIFQQFHLRFSQ
jgi:hypothetical protein